MTNFNNLLNSLSFAQLWVFSFNCYKVWYFLTQFVLLYGTPLVIVKYYGSSFNHSRVLWDFLQSQSSILGPLQSNMGHPLVIVEQYGTSFSHSRVVCDILQSQSSIMGHILSSSGDTLQSNSSVWDPFSHSRFSRDSFYILLVIVEHYRTP